jgi:hypothetical protein
MKYIKVKGGIKLVFGCGDIDCKLCSFFTDKEKDIESCDGIRLRGKIYSKLIKEVKK